MTNILRKWTTIQQFYFSFPKYFDKQIQLKILAKRSLKNLLSAFNLKWQ